MRKHKGKKATTYSPIRRTTTLNGPGNKSLNKNNLRVPQHLGDKFNDVEEFVDEAAENSLNYLNQISTHNSVSTTSTVQLEEVYLCNCCGVTKELDPAMKYMPTFRSLFYLFNFLVFTFGLADLGMGLWFRIDPKVYEIHKYIETQNFTIAGWIMLFGGFLGCIMSFVGCAATIQQQVGLLIVYCASMIVLTCSYIGTVVLLTVHGLGRQLEQFLIKEMYEQIRRRTMNTEVDLFMNADAAQFLDFVQVKMRCCGASDFRDYQKLGMVIPTTCYTIAGNYINAPGCGQAMRELFDIRAGLATAFTTASVLCQLFTIILSALMICSIYNWRANPRPAARSASSMVDRGHTTPTIENNINYHLDDGLAAQSSTQMKTHFEQCRPMSRGSSIAV